MLNVLDVQTSLAKHWRSYSFSTNYHVMNKGSCNAYACGKAWRRNPSHTGVISMESTPFSRTLISTRYRVQLLVKFHWAHPNTGTTILRWVLRDCFSRFDTTRASDVRTKGHRPIACTRSTQMFTHQWTYFHFDELQAYQNQATVDPFSNQRLWGRMH